MVSQKTSETDCGCARVLTKKGRLCGPPFTRFLNNCLAVVVIIVRVAHVSASAHAHAIVT